MKILKLKLRGAIGIRKGQGLEEIEIDFTQFSSGLIALTGKNGSGKSTILENLHPYRSLVSRDGSLQQHFYLKDSHRILEFEFNDIVYQSRILIDALTEGSEAYLLSYHSDGDLVPINDGKVSTYDVEIEKLLGSPDLFFNSVFSGQKSKGIAELKPADRRKLFYELLNLNIYEVYLESAKANLRTNENKLAEIEGEIKALVQDQTSIDILENQRVEALNDQAKIIGDISKIETRLEEINKSIHELTVKTRLAEEKKSRNAEYEVTLTAIANTITEFQKVHTSKIVRLNSEIDDNKKLLERNKRLATPESKAKIDAKLKEKEGLTKALETAKDHKVNIHKQYSAHQKKYSESLKELSEKEKLINQSRLELQSLKKEVQGLNEEYNRRTSEVKIIDKVPCDEDTGGTCQFLINAYKSKNLLSGCKEEKIKSAKKLEEVEVALKVREDEHHAAKQIIDERFQANDANLKSLMQDSETEISRLNGSLADINKDNWEKLNEELKEAGNNITLLDEKIKNTRATIDEAVANFNKEIERLKAQSNDLVGKIDKTLDEVIIRLESESNNLANERSKLLTEIKTDQDILSSFERQIAAIDKDIETVKKNEERVAKLNTAKGEVEGEIKDWGFLTKAFDKTGIPVLKLENSGIEITSIANELLSIFENKFRIVFETTKLKADKKSYKESFDINIIDEDGVCEISNKSGGECVWVETALRLAISLLVRQQGKNLQTSFLDEADGALSLDNAYLYLEMLKNAHQKSGVHNTFIITHRTELLDLLPQQIKLRDGILEVLN